MLLRSIFTLSLVVALAGVAAAASPQDVAPPPNAPASAQWNARDGRLLLRYHGTVILDATIGAEDADGQKVQGAAVKFEPAETRGDKVEQRLKFVLAKPQEGVKLVLQGTVVGSEEAFPAETLSEAHKRFPYVRNSVGLSRNLRNNAVYDRCWDWVLIGPADGATRIQPKLVEEQQITFSWESRGAIIELVFRPRFYQKHKNLPYFEPWTYRVWKGSIAGYCTWWAYKGDFNQKIFDKVLNLWKRKNLRDFGYEYMQIDACFATGGGPEGVLSWNEKFPGGPEYVVSKSKEMGMKPGVHTWIVFRKGDPVNDKMAKEHPDWFMQKPDGSLLNGNTYTLNSFNEDALDRMIRPTYKGLKEQGWEYVKIDGQGDLLQWGYRAFPEHFKKLKSTPGEALRRLNIAAREELGDDIFILGCWSVKPELIGIINGCRLGRDGFGPAEFQYFNSWNGVVWRNDPDHCDIKPEWLTTTFPWFMECVDRKPEGPDPDTIVRPCIISMAGGMLMLSDKAEVYNNDQNLEGIKRSAPVLFTVPGQLYDYNTIESDRVLNNTIDNMERLPEPRINMRHPQMLHPPHRGKEATWWMMEIDKPFENWSVLARFNWRKQSLRWNRDKLEEEEVRFSDIGLSDEEDYLVYEFWSKQFLGKAKGSFTAPAQGVTNGLQVFAIRQARRHPWVLSTTRHISQGGVSLLDEGWDGGGNVLSGKSAVVVGDPYVMTIHLPEGFRLENAEASGENVEFASQKETATVRIVPSATKTVEWKITFEE